jgi:RNA polymerase sigma factor (TIGR02999 family)
MSEVARILSGVEQGDPHAAEQLMPLVYEELRKLAAQRLAVEKPGQTLEATALVHEAYLRLIGNGPGQHWDHRGHFFAAAAEAMRRILVENARRKQRPKHGGDKQRLDADLNLVAAHMPSVDLLALDDALARLAKESPGRAELVKLRFFAGLTVPEAAEILGISLATAERYWTYARTWLFAELGDTNDSLSASESGRNNPPVKKSQDE